MRRSEAEKNYEAFRDLICTVVGLCFTLFILLPTIGRWLYELAAR